MFAAWMEGNVSAEQLRQALTDSGEMARAAAAERAETEHASQGNATGARRSTPPKTTRTDPAPH